MDIGYTKSGQKWQKFSQKPKNTFISAPGLDRAILSVFSDHKPLYTRDVILINVMVMMDIAYMADVAYMSHL